MRVKFICPESKGMDMAKIALNRYLSRLEKFNSCELIEFKPEKKGSPSFKLQKDGEKILNKIQPQDHVILLDEKGKTGSTLFWANQFKNLKESGGGNLVFVVGSPYGLHAKVRDRAQGLWSLSELTFNSEVAMVVASEQLYRIFSYLAGHPYHNE